ncbi:MAG: energy transducer TonB [Gammaproteobacteria bacterium]|nr:energy transducer TonB [Gammaproteobacteria bacterium]
MTSESAVIHAQEVRRQAMLQAMHVDVWLPREQLLNAAPSREYLLQWHAAEQVTLESTEAVAQSSASVVASSPANTEPSARPRSDAYVSVRDKLASLQSATKPVAAPTATPPIDAPALEEPAVAVELPARLAEPIPRFALQLLRAGNCLVLADLPTGEPFQSRDPDYQLLKDMLRAAGLSDQPSFTRQGIPITWPMLHSGQLVHEQNAAAARACVRDLLSVELQSDPAACVWLLGSQAVRFANAADETPLYSLQAFAEGVQLWSLPSLESILEQPLLKRDIWRSMCAIRTLWQLDHEE